MRTAGQLAVLSMAGAVATCGGNAPQRLTEDSVSQVLGAVASDLHQRYDAQRIVVSRQVFCGYPEPCGEGPESVWRSPQLHAAIDAFGWELVERNADATHPQSGADVALRFGNVGLVGSDTAQVFVRSEHQGEPFWEMNVHRFTLVRRDSDWVVASHAVITSAHRADTLLPR